MNVVALRAIRLACLLLALASPCLVANRAHAQTSVEQKAVDRAAAFLKTANRGRDILSFVHFGAQYKGHAYSESRSVLNQPTHFALVYKFNWEQDGVTDLAFLCDGKGNVYEVQVLKSNAQIQQPYALANVSIVIVGNLLLEAMREQLTPEDTQRVRQFIDNPNARGLLEMSLKLQQAFGK